MTTLSPPIAKPAVAPRSPRSSFGDNFTAALIVIIPIALALVCFAARLHVIELSHTVRAELLFALLLALMASGMPISIALGLSVLTYLFILSDVDPKMVGLKLFTSIDRFEIMAIPLGSYLMCFRFLQVMWRFLRTGMVPHPAHGVDYEAPHDTAPPAAIEAAR